MKCFAAGINIDTTRIQAYWQVSFDSVKVNGQSLVGRTGAIINTGSPRIIGPTQSVQAIYSNIPGSAQQGASGVWTSTLSRSS
jgi:hypothetical protein